MVMRGLGPDRTGPDDPARPPSGQHEPATDAATPTTGQATPTTDQTTPTAETAIDEASGPATSRAQRPGIVTGALGMRFVPGTGNPMRWFFSAIWLVYLIQPGSALFGHGHGVLWIAGGLAITLAFCVVYVAALVSWGGRPRLGRAGLVAIAALAALACVVYGAGWLPLWIYVSAATGVVLAAEPNGRRLALRGVLAVGVCYVFFGWLTHDDAADFLVVLLPVLLIGVAMIGFRLQIGLMHELAQARETVAKLAANEERLRLARDMHDLTGQSLSMITLKSELAAKRLGKLPASAERDVVLADLGDIGRVSRQTLHDIREAVSGYRRPTLAIEVITARNALDAAGIRLDDDPGLTLRSGTFDADAEAVLAWCLREAVTNVIRHSGAKNCRIRLTEHPGELSLEVSDDGHGLNHPQAIPPTNLQAIPPTNLQASPPTNAQTEPRAGKGSGLHGMSERLSAEGGRLSLGAADPTRGRGFRLTATVPVDHYDA
jgi:two-component system, NarL family, sensor histidine kinase DesK